jgi:hypothetical protein
MFLKGNEGAKPHYLGQRGSQPTHTTNTFTAYYNKIVLTHQGSNTHYKQ